MVQCKAIGTSGGQSVAVLVAMQHFILMDLKVDSKGDVNIFGIGYIKTEGRTLEDMTKEIQEN